MTIKNILSAFICAMLLIATTGCGSRNNTQKGAAIGAGGGAALGAGISEGSRANIVRLILDNRNQGFLLPLLQDCLLSVVHCSVLDKFHPPILLHSDKCEGAFYIVFWNHLIRNLE